MLEMMIKKLFTLLMLSLFCANVQVAFAQSKNAVDNSPNLLKVGEKVENLVIKDLQGNPAMLPYWGKKNVLIFYVDPDAYLNGNKTSDFAAVIEKNKRAAGPAIEGFGVLDFPDTALPKRLLRRICAKRTEKNGATILEDDVHLMNKQWRLGNCNGKFLLIIVDTTGVVRYIRRQPMDKAGEEEFYRIVDQYRR